MIHENPFRVAERRLVAVEPGTAFVDVLLEEFPEGFGAVPTQVWLNDTPLRVADFDVALRAGDAVTVIRQPGEPVSAALVAFLIATAISLAASFLLGLIFGKPKGPLGAPEESPVYSVSGLANRARRNEPVPDIYGEIVAVPDLAAQPYVYFEDNEQHFVALMALGVGDYELAERFIDDTPVADLAAPNPVTVWSFAPADHGQAFGVIEAATGRYENVNTSVEVGDQELLVDTATLLQATMRIVEPNRIVIEGPELFPASYLAGEQFILSGAVANDGTHTIQVILDGGKELRTVEGGLAELAAGDVLGTVQGTVLLPFNDGGLFGLVLTIDDAAAPDFLVFAAEVTLLYPGGAPSVTGTVDGVYQGGEGGPWQIRLNTASLPPDGGAGVYTFTGSADGAALLQTQLVSGAGIAGPFVACLAGQAARRLEIDIIFPAGLFRTNKRGVTGQNSAGFEFTLQPIDDAGADAGAAIVQAFSIAGSQRSVLRRTVGWDVTPGRYKVSGRRTSTTVDQYDFSQATWAGLKAVLTHPSSAPVYGPVALQLWDIRASNGIAGAGQRRARQRLTRVLPRRAGTLAAAATKNPADAFWNVYTDTATGAGRPVSELDAAAVAALWDSWTGAPGFNAAFDQRSTVWEALTRTVQVVLALPLPLDDRLTLLQEGPKAARAMLFGPGNMLAGTFGLDFAWDGPDASDGIEVEYRDPTSFQPAYALFPAESVSPDKQVLFGCTDQVAAEAFAEIQWRRRLHQRQAVSFETAAEGHLALPLDRIGVGHPLPGWGTQGRILDAYEDTAGWVLLADRPLPWSAVEQDYLVLRTLEGGATAPVAVTQGGTPEEIRLPGAVPTPLALAGTERPTTFSFGSAAGLARDFVVGRIEHKGGPRFELMALAYDERVYDRLPDLLGQGSDS